MNALDFALGCGGVGVLLVCVAISVRIISDVRLKAKASRDTTDRSKLSSHVAITLDPMEQKLREARSSFGLPINPRKVPSLQTWPVTKKSVRGESRLAAKKTKPDDNER